MGEGEIEIKGSEVCLWKKKLTLVALYLLKQVVFVLKNTHRKKKKKSKFLNASLVDPTKYLKDTSIHTKSSKI